jgi:cellulose biosynthesis protein BcsQ
MALCVVCSGKGGVTKTTTTFALGAAFQELKLPVVLVDADPGGSLTEAAGYVADGRQALDLFEGSAAIEQLAVPTTVERIPLVPGTPRMMTLGTTAADLIRYGRALRAAAVGRTVIVDTAQGLTLGATRAALLAADYIVIPMQPEKLVMRRSYPDVVAALKGFKGDAELAGAFPISPSFFFLLTKANAKLRLSRHWMDELALAGITISAVVPTAVEAAEAAEGDQSVIAYAPRGKASEAYRAFARTLIAAMNAAEAKPLAL